MDFIIRSFLISLPHKKATLESESGLFFTLENGTYGARNENLRPLFNINVRGGNKFWPLLSGFLTAVPEKKCFSQNPLMVQF